MHRAILTLLGALLIAQPAFAEIARIKRSMGSATVLRGSASLTPKPGFLLLSGDTLVTGKNGQISLTFSDDTRFSVGPNSRISVDKFEYNPRSQTGEFVTRVNRGSLAVVSGQIAHSKPDAMKVRTPTSLLGVRGTKFIVEVPE
jgi:hypothetical protein